MIAQMAIENLYVDSVDSKKLCEDGIRAMLEKLDPHSTYATPKEVKAMNEPLQGNFDPRHHTDHHQRTVRESGHPRWRPHHYGQ